MLNPSKNQYLKNLPSSVLYSVLLLLIFFISIPALSQTTSPTPPEPTQNDFSYYKKHGHTGKAWNDLVKKGFEAYDQQDCEKTLAFLKQASAAGCHDPIMIFKLATCSELTDSYYVAAQYYKQAEDALKTLSSPHRYTRDFYEAYGRTLYLNKKPDEALPYLIKAAEVGSPSFFLYYLLGSLYAGKQDNATALQYYNKAIQQPMDGAPPTQLAQAYGVIGKSYIELKDWAKAKQYLDLALKNAPNDPDLQQARYKVDEFKRQEDIFKMIEKNKSGGI